MQKIYFIVNSQLVVNLYKDMKQILFVKWKELPDLKPYKDIFIKLHDDWMNKIPELEYYLEADTYNL